MTPQVVVTLVMILADGMLPALAPSWFQVSMAFVLTHQPEVGRRGICQPKGTAVLLPGKWVLVGWAGGSQMCLPDLPLSYYLPGAE